MEAEARRHRQQPIPGNRSSELSCRRRSPFLSLSLFLVFPTRRRFLPFSSFFLSPSFGLNNCDGPRVDINLRAIICLFSLLFPSSFFLSSPLLRKSNPSTSLIGLFETGISVQGGKRICAFIDSRGRIKSCKRRGQDGDPFPGDKGLISSWFKPVCGAESER